MIHFKNISKTYKKKRALHNICFSVEKKERIVLLGGSGSGKTTLLKMVIRLEDPTQGTIFIDEQDFRDLDLISLRRKVGYAIQDSGLFYHMTVFENIAVVLRLLRHDPETIRRKVEQLLAMVGLDFAEFAHKYPAQLSGGQRQRVGVARAFAHDPMIILMDEPFAGLDPITRNQLQNECIDLQTKLDTTMLFVTHDVHEAVKIGHRIVMLKDGEIQQIGKPYELIRHPKNAFVEDFFSYQRFQLFLNSQKLEDMQLIPGPVQQVQIGVHRSLLDLMNEFAQKPVEVISVYKKERFLGNISKTNAIQALEYLFMDEHQKGE